MSEDKGRDELVRRIQEVNPHFSPELTDYLVAELRDEKDKDQKLEILDSVEHDINTIREACDLPAVVLPTCCTCERKQGGDHFYCTGCRKPLCVNCWLAHTRGSGFDACEIPDIHCRECCARVLDKVMDNAFKRVFGQRGYL